LFTFKNHKTYCSSPASINSSLFTFNNHKTYSSSPASITPVCLHSTTTKPIVPVPPVLLQFVYTQQPQNLLFQSRQYYSSLFTLNNHKTYCSSPASITPVFSVHFFTPAVP
jgi:hypothetical protein